MAACDLVELMPDARCYLCLSDKQILAITTALMCRILKELDPMASCDVSDLLAGARDYLFLNGRELGAIQVYLLCAIATTAGQLGATGVRCGVVDPVADPGVDCQIYYNTATGGVWYWNETTGAWVALVV